MKVLDLDPDAPSSRTIGGVTLPQNSQVPPGASLPAGTHFEAVRRQVMEMLAARQNPADRLPSDKQMAQLLGVSNVTVGRVMHDLQRAGVVHRVPGKGTYLKAGTLETALADELARGAGHPASLAQPQSHGASPGRSDNGLAFGSSSRLGEEMPSSVTGVVSGPQFGAPTAPAAAGTMTWILTSFHPGDLGKTTQGWAMRAASSIERAIQRAGGETLLTNTEPYKRAVDPMEILGRLNLERTGVIIVPSGRIEKDCPDLVDRLLNASGNASAWPVVHLPFGQTELPFDSVGLDDERGVYAAVNHLWQLGHKNLAFALPTRQWGPPYTWLQRRVRAFQRAIRQVSAGAVEARFIYGEVEEAASDDPWGQVGRGVGLALVKDTAWEDVTGVVTCNDAMAHEIITVLRDHGREVPADFSVVGFDDNAWSGSLGLTTLHVPVEEMGDQAAALLLQRLAGGRARQRIEIVLEPTLVVRQTTGAPR